jgi:hypothetical protein
MSDRHYLTPEEEVLQRMVQDAGSPQAAARSIIERLEALEAAVAAIEQRTAAPEAMAEPALDPVDGLTHDTDEGQDAEGERE